MLNSIATPTFNDAAALAAYEALFAPRPYDPASALARAQALLPDSLAGDNHWLSFLLLITGGELEWVLRHVNFTAERIQVDRIKSSLVDLSGGKEVLLSLALHLFNEIHPLPPGGLLNLRRLDDYHFELAMHAIRIHSRGVR